MIGHDEDQRSILRAIEFPRIAGGKPFDIDSPWFGELLESIGQAKGNNIARAGHYSPSQSALQQRRNRSRFRLLYARVRGPTCR